MWYELPDYFNGKECKILCMVDTSASMTWTNEGNVLPIEVAVSLGMYCAERAQGPFKDHYLSFSHNPKLVKITGTDFIDKTKRIINTDLCQDTNLEKAFDLLLIAALSNQEAKKHMPETLVIISDMQINQACGKYWDKDYNKTLITDMECIKQRWINAGIKMPKLVYWNVNAKNPTILDASPNVSFVSGCSPILFEGILKGLNGYDLMLDKITSDRYKEIRA